MAFFTAPEIMTMYALGLMICGALAYQASGFQKGAMSSIYVGNGGAAISFLLAAGMRNTKVQKGEKGYKLMMICVHLAVVYPLLMAGIVGWRLSLAWNVPAKAYLKPYLGAIVGMSILASIGMVLLKPKKTTEEEVPTAAAAADRSAASAPSASTEGKKAKTM